jgi:hypothetical protein
VTQPTNQQPIGNRANKDNARHHLPFAIMSSLPKIPPEICLEIFSWILLDGRPSSLSPFCRVSRYYQAEAQRLLYRTVDLRGCNMRQVRSWCLAVTRRTHLAHRVYALFLSLPFDLEASDSGKIGCALNRCVNLKDLRMLHPPTANPNRRRLVELPIRSKS